MKLCTKAVWSLAAAFCFALLCVTSAGAQTVTTGDISGTVVDSQGGVLPGATVTATHTETGTSYEGVTGADGHFSILNVRVGAYTITGEADALVHLRAADMRHLEQALERLRSEPFVTSSKSVIVLSRLVEGHLA